MTDTDRKLFLEVLDIIDTGIDVEHGILTNRFATTTRIIKHVQGQELPIASVDSQRELLIAYDMKVNAVIGSDSDCQRLWSVQTVDEYISNL